MKKEPLSLLDPRERGIVKIIEIIGERNERETILGTVFYKRELSEKYNFSKQKELDERDPDGKLLRSLRGYPQQENYPSDEVDNVLLGAICSRFPKSRVRNEFVLFQLTKDNIDREMKKPAVDARVELTPEFIDMEQLLIADRRRNYGYTANIHIFTPYQSMEELQDLVFVNRFDSDQVGLQDEMESVLFY